MGRKREYDREGMDAAVRVLINSGELTNPIEGVPFVYDVTEWCRVKEGGRRNEETAAELYTMAEGDKCFGTYVEAEDNYKAERGFITGLMDSGYVDDTYGHGYQSRSEQTYDRYYLWAAEGADGHMYNRDEIIQQITSDERNVGLGRENEVVDKDMYYINALSSDDNAYGRTEFEIASTSDKKATQHLADEVLRTSSYLEYLPADDPLRLQGEEAVRTAQQYEETLYPVQALKGYDYHYVGDTIWEHNTTQREWIDAGEYTEEVKIPRYRTEYRTTMQSSEVKEMNAGARAYLTAANEQDLVGTAHEAIAGGIRNENANSEYNITVRESITLATTNNIPSALKKDEFLDQYGIKERRPIEGLEFGNPNRYNIQDEVRAVATEAFQGYAQNFMDRIDYVVPNGEKPDDTTLPGYNAYAEKKAEHVEKQTDEIVHSTIREANKEVTGSRDAVTERVQEYMYSKDTTGMSYGEIMRDPAFIAMSQDIQHEIRNSTQQEIDTVNAGLAEIVKLSNPDATPEQITALVGSEFGGLNYEQRILINGTTLSGKVAEAVANGIVEGKTYTEIKRDVKDVYAKAQYATGRLITTEAARAETRSLEEQLKAEGVEEVEVIAESDACEECLALTGKTYSIDDAPEIPVHPNCRCVIRAIVKK